jgi:hypothetical protein
MTRRTLALFALSLLLLPACAGNDAATTADAAPTTSPAPAAATPSPAPQPTATAAPVATAVPATEPPPSPTPPPLATREGADYVLRLPREDSVPAGWAINPLPAFQRRAPQPGDTYRFACRDLPARSIGIATVGYRHLDGLPSVAIEYVIYASADAAAAALADMRAATETCGDFAIGQGEAATAAALAPLAFDPLGDDSFAAALTTGGDTTGGLLTHVVKVRQGHVVIGVSHTVYADQAPPDAALTRALAERAVENLRDGPGPTGPSAY